MVEPKLSTPVRVNERDEEGGVGRARIKEYCLHTFFRLQYLDFNKAAHFPIREKHT